MWVLLRSREAGCGAVAVSGYVELLSSRPNQHSRPGRQSLFSCLSCSYFHASIKCKSRKL